jgi:3-mercaptopyruvate sulfurtransferase SseA
MVNMTNTLVDNRISTKGEWEEMAKRLLKAELVRRGISHERLSELLGEVGVKVSRAAIDSKLSRGTFSAAFLLQCLRAIGCSELRVDWFNG